jgi:hypothetical protein
VSPGTILGRLSPSTTRGRSFRDLPQPVAVVTGLGPSAEPVAVTVRSLTSVRGDSGPLVIGLTRKESNDV